MIRSKKLWSIAPLAQQSHAQLSAQCESDPGRRLQPAQRHILTILLVASGSLLPAIAQQSTAAICANVCGPRADMTAAQYQKCLQTCGTQASKCLATKAVGTLFPKYYILGLVYAPPGCSKTATLGCSSQSTVDYLDSSTMGTKMSIQSSFQTSINLSVSASTGGTGGDPKFSATASTGWTNKSTDTNSTTISKSTTFDVKASGNGDGVDHDQDTFLLLLNPAIALQQTSTFNTGVCSASVVNWLFGLNISQVPNQALFKVTVGDLKNPAAMPAATAAQLNALNFTTADYQTILAQDPFANGSTAVDSFSARYIPTTTSFPYEPPDTTECASGVCSCVAVSSSLKNELATDVGSSVVSSYKVGLSFSLSGIPVSIFSFGSTLNQTYTWTSSSTTDDTTDSAQTATVSVQCPSINYTGPTLMTVYWDKLYGSFLFVPNQLTAVQPQILTQGTLTNASGQVLRHQPVTFSASGKALHTYSDSNGKYLVVAPPGLARPATGQLSTMGIVRSVAVGSTQDIKTAQ
jgi:hypothetical protein